MLTRRQFVALRPSDVVRVVVEVPEDTDLVSPEGIGLGLEPVFMGTESRRLARFHHAFVSAAEAKGFVRSLRAFEERVHEKYECVQLQTGPFVGWADETHRPCNDLDYLPPPATDEGKEEEVHPCIGPLAPLECVPGATLGSLRTCQRYLDSRAEGGLGAEQIWRASPSIAGSKGKGCTVADIELGWLPHPQIKGLSAKGAGAETGAHGTAVLGVLVAPHESKGTVGLVPEADYECVHVCHSRTHVISQQIGKLLQILDCGSVILVEAQYALVVNHRGQYCATPLLPVETACDAFAAIEEAVKKGIHVVQAAGNGGVDIGRFLPGKRNSGSIVVGAGEHATGAPTGSTNYGARIDLFSWGDSVVTLGAWVDGSDFNPSYGSRWRDLWPGEKANKSQGSHCYTKSFNGSSSAAAIVAGAVCMISSIVASYSRSITPLELRDALRQTGYCKSASKGQLVGVHPDLVALCHKLVSDGTLPREVGQALSGATD